MWSSRFRNREEEERHQERTTDRLRRVGASERVNGDSPEQIRARLERMQHGANRQRQPSESPA